LETFHVHQAPTADLYKSNSLTDICMLSLLESEIDRSAKAVTKSTA